jgi:hypothetical protein
VSQFLDIELNNLNTLPYATLTIGGQSRIVFHQHRTAPAKDYKVLIDTSFSGLIIHSEKCDLDCDDV